MQWHWHEYRVTHQLQHTRRIPDGHFDIRQREKPAVVFQLVHQRSRRSFEEYARPPFAKGRSESLAMRAHPLSRQLAIKRMPAYVAGWRLNKIEFLRALRTNMTIQAGLNQSIAGNAHWWKRHIAQAARESLE